MNTMGLFNTYRSFTVYHLDEPQVKQILH